jgi:hypothetical protein
MFNNEEKPTLKVNTPGDYEGKELQLAMLNDW